MAPGETGVEQPRKAHRVAKSGAKARKKKGKGAAGDDEGGERKNPKVRKGPAVSWVSLSERVGFLGACFAIRRLVKYSAGGHPICVPVRASLRMNDSV